MPSKPQPLVIQTPSSFPYKNKKVVPWKYGVSIIQGEPKEELVDQGKVVVDNISGIGGMTGNGRLFTPPDLKGEKIHEHIREEVAMKKAKSFLKEKVVQNIAEDGEKEKKEITNEQACELLRFIQQSEYKLVDQLNRMLARVSLMELLTHSPFHEKLLMKILSGANVEKDISLDKFEGIVNHITANNYLTFTDDEIPSEGGVITKFFIFLSNA